MVKYAQVYVCDWDGTLRGKYVPEEKLCEDIGFSLAAFSWSMEDEVFEEPSYSGWRTGFPDGKLQVDVSTERHNDLDGKKLYLSCFSGKAEEVCPRSILKKVITKSESLGYSFQVGIEFEFTLTNTNKENELDILNEPMAYSAIKHNAKSWIMSEILRLCSSMDIPLAGLHFETGSGVLEASLKHCAPLEAADRAVIFKTIIKAWALQNGMQATFMAKMKTDHPGHSGHIHFSAKRHNKNAFFNHGLDSDSYSVLSSFISGQLECANQLLPLYLPNYNSYKRIVDYSWAPTTLTWGVDNRTCMLRVVGDSEDDMRIENRLGGSDINPYLTIAAILASGIWGVENGSNRIPKTSGNAYESPVEDTRIITEPKKAIMAFRDSKIASEFFGSTFVNYFSLSRLEDYKYFETRVSDLEYHRYVNKV